MTCNFRRLFAKKRDRAPERLTVGEYTPLTGMIESGDFKIDLDGRTVTLCDQELQLTSEEFDVLVFLASHPQSLVTPRTNGDKLDCESTSPNRVLKSLAFPPQEARCCRTWQALPSN